MQPYHAPPPPMLELHLHRNHPEPEHHPMVVEVNVPVVNPYHRVQQIIQAISRTVPQAERQQVLESTLEFLSHEDATLHDYEIDMGADRALCLQLGYLDLLQASSPTNSDQQQQQQQETRQVIIQWDNDDNEVQHHTRNVQSNNNNGSELILICWCLNRVYQCSREKRFRSFQEIGISDLVPILAKILKRCCGDTANTTANAAREYPSSRRRALSRHMDMMVPVLRILRIFAKLNSQAKSALLRWKNGRLLAVLVDILAINTDNDNNNNGSENNNNNGGDEHLIRQSVVAMESLGVLKDLSFRLNDNDKEFMYRFLRDTLVQYSFTTTSNDASTVVAHSSLYGKLLESVAAMFWNFATAPKLSAEMAQQPMLMRSLGQLLQYNGQGGNVEDEDSVKIKRNALSALGNLVAVLTREPRGMVLATTPTRGEQEAGNNATAFRNQDWILTVLPQMIHGESDRDIQRRAMRTIRCLTGCAWGREFLWEGSSELKACLSTVLGDRNRDFDVATRIQACETIVCLSQVLDIMKNSSPVFEMALSQAIARFKDQPNLEEQAQLIAATCRALFLCLERRPHSQSCDFPHSDDFFVSLLACSKVEKEDTHPPIAQLLLKLATTDIDDGTANQTQNQEAVDATTETTCISLQKAMLSTPVLDTIKELMLAKGPLFNESQSNALDLMHHFLRNKQNKKMLAKNAELLSAMVEFLLVSDQDDKKRLAKAMVLEIVPEI